MSDEAIQAFRDAHDQAKRRGISLLALMREEETLPEDLPGQIQAFAKRAFGVDLTAEDVEKFVEAVAPVAREVVG